jgi:DNA-3-methyladenine glycosylase
LKPGPRLSRVFFSRPATAVARDLIGTLLVHRLADGRRVAGRIVEVEAYLGDGSDPSAHSHGGPTPRNQTMFGPPGRLYAYRSYGIHTCVNVVCEPAGVGAALRALEPRGDVAAMRALRGMGPDAPARELARGPGRLGQAMGFTLEHDGASLLRGPIALHAPPAGTPQPRVETGPRVGITKAAQLPYRFFEPDSVWVSPFRPGKPRKRHEPLGPGA